MESKLKVGDLCMYRYNRRAKWKEGRIAEINPSLKTMYKIEAYAIDSVINWPEVMKMVDGKPAGEMIKRNVPGWYFKYWLIRSNVKPINIKNNI